MLTLAIANNKGGSGKTSVAVHLADGVARSGRRVALVDLDPQGNATTWFLGKAPADGLGSAEALLGHLNGSSLRPVEDRPNLFLVPATDALAGVDARLASEVAGETLLGRALQGLAGKVELVVFDCPPALDLTVVSALCASSGVIVPVPASFLALAGLARLHETVERVVDRLKASTRVLGTCLFAADGREGITAEVRGLLRRQLGDGFYESEIRVSTAAKALPAQRKTAWDPSADPRGREDYVKFMAETKKRLQKAGLAH